MLCNPHLPSALAALRSLLSAALAFGLLLVVMPATAHTVGKGLATITVSGQTIQYHLLLALSAAPQDSGSLQLTRA